MESIIWPHKGQVMLFGQIKQIKNVQRTLETEKKKQ